jgi:hypothetical protein
LTVKLLAPVFSYLKKTNSVTVIKKLPQKPSNTTRSSWPFEKEGFPDRKKILQREDGSRLCLLLALGGVLGITADTTTKSSRMGALLSHFFNHVHNRPSTTWTHFSPDVRKL